MTIAPTTQTIERNIRSYVAEGAALSTSLVIAANKPGVSPTEPYATVLLVSDTLEGYTWSSDAAHDDGIEQTSYESVNARYSVQFFRTGARDRALTFRLWAYSQSGVLSASRRGITLYTASTVLQTDRVVSEEWEERASIDIDLGIVRQIQNVINLAETISIVAERDGETPYTETISGS